MRRVFNTVGACTMGTLVVLKATLVCTRQNRLCMRSQQLWPAEKGGMREVVEQFVDCNQLFFFYAVNLPTVPASLLSIFLGWHGLLRICLFLY